MKSPTAIGPWIAVALLAGVTGGCVSTTDIDAINSQLADIQKQLFQLHAQSSSKDEMASLQSSVGKQMEQVLQSEATLKVQVDSLSSQIEQLQSKLEDTNFRLSQLSQQIATTNQELKTFRSETRLAASETSPADPNAPGAPPAPGATTTDPQALYQSAYNDYLRGNYPLAQLAFEEYLANFRETDLADNATYWIAECQYRQGKYRPAIEQYDKLAREFPKSDKLPSALLKKGYALLELGERPAGIVELQKVLRDYPTSDEANVARDRLKALGLDSRR